RTGRMPVIEKENASMDTNEDTDAMMTMHEFRDWVASRKAAAATIHIETCELGCWYGQVLDPYGLLEVQGELPEEVRQVGRNHCVRSSDSGGWINEHDLSPAQAQAMHARFEREYLELEVLPF